MLKLYFKIIKFKVKYEHFTAGSNSNNLCIVCVISIFLRKYMSIVNLKISKFIVTSEKKIEHFLNIFAWRSNFLVILVIEIFTPICRGVLVDETIPNRTIFMVWFHSCNHFLKNPVFPVNLVRSGSIPV